MLEHWVLRFGLLRTIFDVASMFIVRRRRFVDVFGVVDSFGVVDVFGVVDGFGVFNVVGVHRHFSYSR